jgi:ribonucleoside-diphosphate reductase alpha chain
MQEMMSAKTGAWWELNPQRARANNSAVALRHRATEIEFFNFWDRVKESKSGEPGVYFSNNQEWGANPCVEIGLRPYQFCNLVEINASDLYNQVDLEQRCQASTTIATLQASYTDFHYLREIWKETTEKDALIGVSMTGIASGAVLDLDIKKAVSVVRKTNEEMAEKLGINPAARLTCVKPAGTTSCVLGTSSGIHAWHNDYYFRRIRVGKNEAIYAHLEQHHPELVEDDFFSPSTQAVITVPIKAPEGAITRQESNIDFLERVRKFSVEWIQEGHIKGQNSHNVSATVTIKEDEWESTGKWMWENRNIFNGLSVLPYDGGTYVQAPFEDCTEEQYKELFRKLKDIDLTDVLEYDDTTNLQGEIACGGGSCEIK